MNKVYILDIKKEPVSVDFLVFVKWFDEGDNNLIERTDINKDIYVSTIFLGIDHGFNREVPILFETMVFGSEIEECIERYATYNEAVAGHRKKVEEVSRLENLDIGISRYDLLDVIDYEEYH